MFRVTILKHTSQVINKMNTIKVTNAKNIIKEIMFNLTRSKCVHMW